MKRIAVISLTLILLFCSCFFTTSAEEDPTPIVVEYGTITVIFDGNTTLDEAQRLAIAQMLSGEAQATIGGENHVDNILCNIFGHKKTTEPLIVVEHNVRSEAPRCLEHHGDLTTCSRCDYSNFEIEYSTYIFCH